MEERSARKVVYADRFELEQEIVCRSDAYEDGFDELLPMPPAGTVSGGMIHTPAPEPKTHHGAPRRLPMRPMGTQK